jgi:hypothetical protein
MNWPMTNEERQRMLELCQQIAVEEDYCRMIGLVGELNDVIEAEEKRLRPQSTSARQSPNV